MNDTDNKKNTALPKLRFAEFMDTTQWRKIKLIDTADKKIKWSFIGGPFGSNLKASDYVDNGIRVIQLQNIGDSEFLNSYKIYTSEEKADQLLSCNIYPGDIILSKMGDPIGRACLIPNDQSRYVMCSDGIRLVVNTKLFNKYFIFSLINSFQFRNIVEKAATGSTRKRIALDDLKNLTMFVPEDIEEQQKIADCLSSVDELITEQSQKIDSLQKHKKGLMQQLFPAEGETVPRLRFPEFLDCSSWTAIYANRIFKQINNRKHNSDLPILAITQEYGAIPREMIDYNVSVTEKSLQSYKVVDAGDFIISLRTFQGGIEYSKYKGICSPAYIVLRNVSEANKDFFK